MINKIKIEGTIFHDSEKPNFSKAFEDKATFKYLHSNFEEILTSLRQKSIHKVMVFDQLGENWTDWETNEKLTLAVLPISNIIIQKSKDTKDKYVSRGYTDHSKLFPITLQSNEIHRSTDFVEYFPTRNLLIAKINPFAIPNDFNLIIQEIIHLNPKTLSELEIKKEKLTSSWGIDLEKTKQNKIDTIKNKSDTIDNYSKSISDLYSSKLILTEELKHLDEISCNLTDKLFEQFDAIKDFSRVENLVVKDKLYFTFKNIYINDVVSVFNPELGVTESKRHKVYIGDLDFEIGNTKVNVTNANNSVGGYPHPHATGSNICFGEQSVRVRKLLRELRLKELVVLLFSWSQSFNASGSPYTSLQNFQNKANQIMEDDYLKKIQELAAKEKKNNKKSSTSNSPSASNTQSVSRIDEHGNVTFNEVR